MKVADDVIEALPKIHILRAAIVFIVKSSARVLDHVDCNKEE